MKDLPLEQPSKLILSALVKRDALFNVLFSHIDFEGKRFLDLFSGSGAVGIEALSRGFESVTFCEKNINLFLKISAGASRGA